MNQFALRVACVSAIVATMLGCGQSTETLDPAANPSPQLAAGPTWEAFKSSVYREPHSGVYIVDGDTPIEDIKQLREFYEQHVENGQLIIHRQNNVDLKWNDTHKLDLRYCISTTFGANHAKVVAAFNEATRDWQLAANVKYIYVPAQDSSCTNANTNVIFDVNPVNSGGQYTARAFLPNQSRSTRNVLIDGTAFSMSATNLAGVIRHELGHTLGFRHEHTRPEAAKCFEDNNWRALTPYDSASVMHYPQCNGTNTWALPLTANDKTGVVAIYGASGTAAPPPPSGTAVVETVTGSVAANASNSYGPFSVVAGTTFHAKMTGSGDADLYVRFGSAPTTSAYNCRPYLSGSVETCSPTVPAGQTTAYVMVRGYSAATYSVELRYTKPSTPAVADTTAPTFGGLATATATSSSQVQLAWTAASDTVTAASAIVYDVYRSTSSSMSFDAPLMTTSAGATSVTVTGLTANTTYWFAVRARDAAGNRDGNTFIRSATTQASTTESDFEDRVVALVNQRRAAGATCGGTAYPAAPALASNDKLRQAARLHSQDMAAKNYFSHTSQDGRTFDQRIRAAGYTSSPMGENIAAGQPTPEQVVTGWMNSSGHCRNIMNASYRSIGVGYAYSASSTYRHYWTQDFGGQ